MKGIYKDTLLGVSAKIIAMVFYMLTDILIVRLLPYEKYGEWSFYYSIASILFILTRFGFNSSTQVFVAGSQDGQVQKRLIIQSFFTRLLISLFFALMILTLLPRLSPIFGYPEKYPELKILFCILPLLCFFNSFVDYFKCLNIGLVKFKYLFWVTIAEYLNNLAFGIVGILLFKSIYGLAAGYSFAYLATALIGMLFIFSHMKKYQSEEKTYPGINKKIIQYSIPVFLTNFISVLLMDMDTFMLGLLCEAGESGLYSIAKNLMTKITNFNLTIADCTMTIFAILTIENLKEKKKKFINLAAFNITYIAAICFGCILFGKPIILFLYGASYAGSVPVLISLIPYYAFFSLSLLPAILLNYQRMAIKSLKCNIVMFLCNLTLNVLLIPKYGAIGAAAATSISIIPYTLLLYHMAFKIFKGDSLKKKRPDKENI